MQFKLFQLAIMLFASLVMVSAVPTAEPAIDARAPDTPGVSDEVSLAGDDVGAQEFNVGHIWKKHGKHGTRGVININGIPSHCYNYISSWDNTVTSIEVDKGIYCDFYVNRGCSGPYVRVNGAYAPNLGGTNYDNSLSSYRCYAA